MKSIALFGSSGKTGLEIIQYALTNNFTLKAFCRDKNSIFLLHANLSIIQGDILNYNEVLEAINNSNYVISALGHKPPYKDIFCKAATENITKAMKECNVNRILCITGAMIGNYPENLSPFMKFLAKRFNKSYSRIADDRAAQEKVIKNSGLDWTILKPPRLSDGKQNKILMGENLKATAFSSISRASLAAHSVDILDDKSAYNKALFVTN